MSNNLYDASKQWATRPADQRFWTVQEMHDACKGYASSACEADVALESLRVKPMPDGDIALCGNDKEAKFTNWSFKQLCTRVKAPSGYLATLPGIAAAQCLNVGLKTLEAGQNNTKALFHQNGSLVARAFLSEAYNRIWNYQVCEKLLGLGEQGWKVPPARPALSNQPGVRTATQADVLALGGLSGLAVKVGDPIAPAGLYASDHDMFAFMVNEDNRIADGTDGGMGRGFFISNSEVGAAAFKIKKFLYRYVCGNHIVWGATGVEEIRIVHVGTADRRYGYALSCELRKYANASAKDDEDKVKVTKTTLLGQTTKDVVDKLFGMKIMAKQAIETAMEYAEKDAAVHHHDPKSAWGVAQGITAMSQDVEGGYFENRAALDMAAGKVLQIAF